MIQLETWMRLGQTVLDHLLEFMITLAPDLNFRIGEQYVFRDFLMLTKVLILDQIRHVNL
jgi:hypothetical protein